MEPAKTKQILRDVSPKQVQAALEVSSRAGSMEAFYGVVGMTRKSRSFFIQHGHRLHSLKAIITYAGKEVDQAFSSGDFSSEQAARLLMRPHFKRLNFRIVHSPNKADRRRERRWIQVLDRPQQVQFREKLIDLYAHCPFTSCSTLTALEAAHVVPVSEDGSDESSNGILLRVDLHKLFDANLIAIDPNDGKVHVAESCLVDYGESLREMFFKSPAGGPSLDAFAARWKKFKAHKEGI